MSVRAEQAKWAVIVLMRENPPRGLRLEDERRIDADELDLDLALGAFSQAVSRGDLDERLTAVEALVWLSDRRAISPLLRGLEDAMWYVRHAAAHGLTSFRPLPGWALEPIAAAMVDAEPAVRAQAASALGRLRHAGSITPLVTAVEDHFSCVRLAAAWALEELGRAAITDPTAADSLSDLLEREDDQYVAYAAYWALGWQGGSAAEAQRAAFRWSDRGQAVWSAVARI
jgi:HEAT repeat protein